MKISVTEYYVGYEKIIIWREHNDNSFIPDTLQDFQSVALKCEFVDMGRVKSGQKVRKKYLWKTCGGVEQLSKIFRSASVTKNTPWSSKVWSVISNGIFGVNTLQYCKWLNVVWKEHRKGLRTLVTKTLKASNKKPGLAPLSADHHSPVDLTDESDGEHGSAPPFAARHSPVDLTGESDEEHRLAVASADRHSSVFQAESDGERGSAPTSLTCVPS